MEDIENTHSTFYIHSTLGPQFVATGQALDIQEVSNITLIPHGIGDMERFTGMVLITLNDEQKEQFIDIARKIDDISTDQMMLRFVIE